MKKSRVIGVDALRYAQLRNFAGLEVPGYAFKKVFDYHKIINHIYFKLKNKTHPFHGHFFNDFGLNNVSLYHFFNTVNLGRKKPWIVTFEADLPRHNSNFREGIESLAADNCLKIIAISEKASTINAHLLSKQSSQFRDAIMAKTIVLQPPQKLYIQNLEDKITGSFFTFSFVGVNFFQKGGMEVLKAIDRLVLEGYEFRVNMVSQIKKAGWRDDHISQQDFVNAEELISKHKSTINYYRQLTNPDVIQLLRSSDVMLFPSYGETYGYVVLEAQATGTPVITPNLPPFTEFNSNETGWLIDVPYTERNGVFESDVYSEKGLAAFTHALTEGVYNSMKYCLEHRAEVTVKAKRSIERIRASHNPEVNSAILKKIYDSAF